MATAFDPNTHSIITDANGNPVPQKYDPTANSGAGGFVVLNADNDKVTLNGSNELESDTFSRSGSISAGVEETIVDIQGKPCILESLALGTDDYSIGILFYPYQDDGTLGPEFRIPKSDGTSLGIMTPYELEFNWNGENDFMKNYVYDTNNNKFTMGMKRSANFNNGIKITVKNAAGSQQNAAVLAMISTKQ